MNMIVQGTAEWHAIRVGKVTASRVADVMARTKTGWGASRANYMAELIAERLTGEPAEGYTNAIMQRGNEKEPDARAAYEFLTDASIVQIGFVSHPTIATSGASPDGLVGDDGLVEIKCPNTATHIETLLGNAVPGKYVSQMLWQMACSGRQWCDFVSFDPRLPESMRLFVRRVHRDDRRIAEIEGIVVTFLGELDQKVSELINIYEPDFPSGAVAGSHAAHASDESARANAAPPQQGETNMGGAAAPAKKLPPLTGLLADRHRDNLVRQIGQLETANELLYFGKDAKEQIARLPDHMQEPVRSEFSARQRTILGG
jgi:putative phage-type endonuclease